MEESSHTNGFEIPPPQLSPSFTYLPQHEQQLQHISHTNEIDTEWSTLRDVLKYKLAEAITSFLSTGPPFPLEPQDAYQARSRAYDTLDSFSGPPFTIQRLCELFLTPQKSYTSLPKYLRALNRVLSVTSERDAFTEDSSDDHPLQPQPLTTSVEDPNSQDYNVVEDPSSLGVVHDGMVISPAHHTHRRSLPPRSPSPAPSSSSSTSSSSSSSTSSSSTITTKPQVVPLLSPIPWLSRSNSSSSSQDDLHPTTSSSPSRSTTSLHNTIETIRPSSSSTIPTGLDTTTTIPVVSETATTTTPTGGLVDEVDPGTGGSETSRPIALSHAMGETTKTGGGEESTSLRSNEGEGSSGNGKDEKEEAEDSLARRFTRASSPKSTSEQEQRVMMMDGIESRIEGNNGNGEDVIEREGGGEVGKDVGMKEDD